MAAAGIPWADRLHVLHACLASRLESASEARRINLAEQAHFFAQPYRLLEMVRLQTIAARS